MSKVEIEISQIWVSKPIGNKMVKCWEGTKNPDDQ